MPQINTNLITLSAADRQLIEKEHARLERFLCDLSDICSEHVSIADGLSAADCRKCGNEKFSSCQGLLPSFFYDFHDLLAEHFESEEKIMISLPQTEALNKYFRQHQEDHALLMQELQQLIQESTALVRQGNIAEAILQFQQLIKSKLREHDHFFDGALMNGFHGW